MEPFSSELLLEHAVLFTQVGDCLGLLPVDPAGEDGQEELDAEGNGHDGRILPNRSCRRMSCFWKPFGRVERWRGGLGRRLCSPLARSFVCECHSISTVLRFHLPLIKPDVQISCIRLSDKDSCFRPRDVAVTQAQLDETKLVVQVFIGES